MYVQAWHKLSMCLFVIQLMNTSSTFTTTLQKTVHINGSFNRLWYDKQLHVRLNLWIRQHEWHILIIELVNYVLCCSTVTFYYILQYVLYNLNDFNQRIPISIHQEGNCEVLSSTTITEHRHTITRQSPQQDTSQYQT